MSAVIAHEVRTPLGVMLSSAQILQREPQLSSEGRELAGFIESETARLSRLISAMLEGARPRDPAIAPTDMNALVHHASALLAAQAARQGVTIQTHGSGRETLHPCDEEQMTQVL
jgi:signal transduction histidine kinase